MSGRPLEEELFELEYLSYTFSSVIESQTGRRIELGVLRTGRLVTSKGTGLSSEVTLQGSSI
jgi:hypothetical protein